MPMSSGILDPNQMCRSPLGIGHFPWKKNTLGSMPWNMQVSLCHLLPSQSMSSDFFHLGFQMYGQRIYGVLDILEFGRGAPSPQPWLSLIPILKGSHPCPYKRKAGKKGRKVDIVWILDLKTLIFAIDHFLLRWRQVIFLWPKLLKLLSVAEHPHFPRSSSWTKEVLRVFFKIWQEDMNVMVLVKWGPHK